MHKNNEVIFKVTLIIHLHLCKEKRERYDCMQVNDESEETTLMNPSQLKDNNIMESVVSNC
jgi:hypothetical protein